MQKTALPRVLPFALFMSFIAVEEMVQLFNKHGMVLVERDSLLFLYPVKTVVVFVTLIACWQKYDEIQLSDLKHLRHTLVSVLLGLLVFFLWINMDWTFASMGTPSGYNPDVKNLYLQWGLIGFRIFGASLVVPVMEELFWRSFLMRYITSNDFTSIPIGTFKWGSFITVAILFGMEHNFFLAGIVAGIFYNILICYTKSLTQCVLAHSLTNLCLAIYVLSTEKWYFW